MCIARLKGYLIIKCKIMPRNKFITLIQNTSINLYKKFIISGVSLIFFSFHIFTGALLLSEKDKN